MYACTYACKYVCMYICMLGMYGMCIRMHVFMYVWYVCTYILCAYVSAHKAPFTIDESERTF